MRFTVHLKLLLAFSVLCQIATAQNVAKTSISPSPEGMSSIKDIQSPVSYYTGTVNVSVPLYTINYRDIAVPISFNYQTSGIKVSDVPTYVGLGWRHSSGGKVTRVVKGWPDELPNKHNSTPLWFNWPYEAESTPMGTPEYYRKIINRVKSGADNSSLGYYDLEPDLFYFEIPGKAGMFVFDHDGVAHTIPYQNVFIDWVDRSYFRIVDDNGSVYTFGLNDSKENSETQLPIPIRSDYQDDKYKNNPWRRDRSVEVHDEFVEYTSTWWLDKIETVSGNSIEFSYQTGDVYTCDNYDLLFSITMKNSDSWENPPIDISPRLTWSAIHPKYINEIIWDGGKIEYSYENPSQYEYGWALKQMKIFDLSTPITQYEFGHSYFRNGNLRLDQILQGYGVGPSGKGEILQTVCDFRYNTRVNLPARNSNRFDHWGYYNENLSSKYYPTITWTNYGQLSYVYEGADRTPSFNHTSANVLEEVVYQDGRTTKYEYELNESSGYSVQAGGLRIKSIIHADGVKTMKTSYRYSSGQLLCDDPVYYAMRQEYGGIVYIWGNARPINNVFDYSGSHIGYTMVTEMLPNGSRNVYEFSTKSNGNYDDISCKRCWYILKNNTMSQEVPPRFNGNEVAFCINTSRFWRRGLLLKRTSYSRGSQTPVESIINTYGFGTIKDSVECYLPELVSEDKANVSPWSVGPGINAFKWISEQIMLVKTEVLKGPYNMPSVSEYTYDDVYGLPTKVRQTDCEGNRETHIKYPFNYDTENAAWNSGSNNVLALKYMRSKGVLNCPVEQLQYKNNSIVSGAVNLFDYSENGINKVVLRKNMALYLDKPLSAWFQHSLISPRGEFIYDSRYEAVEYMDEYDEGNVLISSHKSKGLPESVIYGYDKTLPIAVVQNAVHSIDPGRNEVFHTSFEEDTSLTFETEIAKSGDRVLVRPYTVPLWTLKPGQYILSYWEYDMTDIKWMYRERYVWNNNTVVLPASPTLYIDEVRVMPANASMVTCTYKPGLGKTSQTDHLGYTSYYEYNSMGLLLRVFDNDRILRKKNTYDNIEN